MRGRPKAKAVKEYKRAFDRKFARERQVVTRFELPEQALARVRELLRRERLKTTLR